MKTSSIRDYFFKCITSTNSLMPKEMKLQKKEIAILVESCYFNFKGGDLNNFKDWSEYILGKGLLSKKTDCSVYKTKLGSSKWATTARNLFRLPINIDIREEDLVDGQKVSHVITVEYEHNRKNTEQST